MSSVSSKSIAVGVSSIITGFISFTPLLEGVDAFCTARIFTPLDLVCDQVCTINMSFKAF